jgi:Arf-GAP with SH3 domain, ANK repeat and PH domain-containing protein
VTVGVLSELTRSSQDTEVSSSGFAPNFILKLTNDDELVFTFTFVIRQSQQIVAAAPAGSEVVSTVDTQINGLTYVYASTPREVENLVTREFHADPNLHKNANVELVGDYNTGGSQSVSFEWSWKWKPPKNIEDKGGGWRNSCSVRVVSRCAPVMRTKSCLVRRVRSARPPSPHAGQLLLLRR